MFSWVLSIESSSRGFAVILSLKQGSSLKWRPLNRSSTLSEMFQEDAGKRKNLRRTENSHILCAEPTCMYANTCAGTLSRPQTRSEPTLSTGLLLVPLFCSAAVSTRPTPHPTDNANSRSSQQTLMMENNAASKKVTSAMFYSAFRPKRQ